MEDAVARALFCLLGLRWGQVGQVGMASWIAPLYSQFCLNHWYDHWMLTAVNLSPSYHWVGDHLPPPHFLWGGSYSIG